MKKLLLFSIFALALLASSPTALVTLSFQPDQAEARKGFRGPAQRPMMRPRPMARPSFNRPRPFPSARPRPSFNRPITRPRPSLASQSTNHATPSDNSAQPTYHATTTCPSQSPQYRASGQWQASCMEQARKTEPARYQTARKWATSFWQSTKPAQSPYRGSTRKWQAASLEQTRSSSRIWSPARRWQTTWLETAALASTQLETTILPTTFLSSLAFALGKTLLVPSGSAGITPMQPAVPRW